LQKLINKFNSMSKNQNPSTKSTGQNEAIFQKADGFKKAVEIFQAEVHANDNPEQLTAAISRMRDAWRILDYHVLMFEQSPDEYAAG
jgi:hypothetical protein